MAYQELCEGMGLKNWGIHRWMSWLLAVTVLASGCSGVLFESKEKSGATESIKLDSGETWADYDTHPRYPYDKKNSNDEMSIMLKSVRTF
jgi:hypothetical protein